MKADSALNRPCEMSFSKQLLDEVQGRGRGYQPKPKAEADNFYQDLDYSGYHKNRI